MKDQYFGDVNDFRKYGLLRLLSDTGGFRLGVCWMMTVPDGNADGHLLNYLQQPNKYRLHDPELFDWLTQVVIVKNDRRVARIEGATLLGKTLFKSEILTDSVEERRAYFSHCDKRFAGCDLVFFDPDNGLEIKSKPRGRKGSCKYLYWDEMRNISVSRASVLIYQHFIRNEPRDSFVARLVSELYKQTNATTVFTFRTPRVVFLLSSQAAHTDAFRKQLPVIQSRWGPTEIIGMEHPPPNPAP